MKNFARHPLLAFVVTSVVFALACDLLPGAPSIPVPGLPSLPGLAGATPTPAGPPGVYATNIRIDPPAVYAATPVVTFFVTFENTTGSGQTLSWRVKIFRAQDRERSFGETAAVSIEIPNGSSELPSAQNWKANVRTCEQYVARVFFNDPSRGNQPFEFLKPDQSPGPEFNFQVCP